MRELRKIQQTGGSTLIVSLPRKWANSHGLEKGNSISIYEGENNTLIFNPHPEEEEVERKRNVILQDENTEHLFRKLIAIYISGFDSMTLVCESSITPEMRSTIRRFTRMVIGPEITEEDINSVHIKDLTDPYAFEMKSIVKRIFSITFSMVNDSLNSIMEMESELARDVVSRDTEVDRLYWLLYKEYNLIKKGTGYGADEKDSMNDLNLYLVGRILERVADHAKNISDNFIQVKASGKNNQLNEKMFDKFLEAGEVGKMMLKTSFNSFINNKIELANVTIDDVKEIKNLYNEAVSNISGTAPANSIYLAGIMDSIKRIGMYASDIAEITINNQFDK